MTMTASDTELRTRENLLEELQWLVQSQPFQDLPLDVLASIRKTAYEASSLYFPDFYPADQLHNILCIFLGKDRQGLGTVRIGPIHAPLEKDFCHWVMTNFGLDGRPVFRYNTCDKKEYAFLKGWPTDIPGPDWLPTLSERTARMLNLRADGLTLAAIAKELKISTTTVTDRLHRARFHAEKYGFWQMWPATVPLSHTDTEYMEATSPNARGKSSKQKGDGPDA